jgi:hypothetical protein
MTLGRRLLVIGLSTLPFLLGSLLLYGFTHLGLVETDPIPFDGRNLKATYQAGDQELLLTFDKKARVYGVSGPIDAPLEVDEHGTAITKQGKLAYSPFWLPFSNPVISFNTKNPIFPVYDTTGVLGAPNTEYLAKQESTFIMMDDILQSQASYRYGLFSLQGKRVASAVYDATCGMLFNMQIKQPEKSDLRLLKTNFPVSRNRNWLVIFNVLLGAGLIFLLYRREKKSPEKKIVLPAPLSALVALGVLCLATDTLLDIWHPYLFGQWLPLAWHIALVIPIALIGRRAAIVALAEIAMAAAFWIYLKGPAVPFFFIPGSTVAFFLALGVAEPKAAPAPSTES